MYLQDGTVDHSHSYPLREPYITTLCVADALGILDSIAAIAKSVHRQQKSRDPAVAHVSVLETREVDQDEDRSKDDSKNTSTVDEDPATVTNTVEKELMPQPEKNTCEDSENAEMTKNKGDTCTLAPEASGKSASAHIDHHQNASDQSSDNSASGFESEDERSEDDDHLDSSSTHQPSSSSVSEGRGTQEDATEKISDSGCRHQQDEASKTFHVKSKLLNLVSKNGKSRQKKRRNRHQRLEIKDRRKSSQLPKPSKRKRDSQLLYGMGAGSFSTVREHYMNS